MSADRPCPRGGERLRARLVGPAEMLLCDGCGGLWISRNDLESYLTTSSEQWKLPSVPSIDTPWRVPRDTAVCPCPDRAMMETVVEENVQIEVCPSCGGVWLDGGALQALVRETEEKAKRQVWQTTGSLGTLWEVLRIVRRLLGAP